MVDEYELLAMELAKENLDTASSNRARSDGPYIAPGLDYQQWVVAPTDTFQPAGHTVPKIPAGVYKFGVDDHGRIYIEKMKVITDDLLILPDSANARIINRPSRFDEIIYVGMPSPEAREVYLRNVAPEIDEKTLSRWVVDTDKMSVAHLKELAVAILCLDQEYDDVIKRLRSMQIKPREIDGFGNGGNVGFDLRKNNSAAQSAPTPSVAR